MVVFLCMRTVSHGVKQKQKTVFFFKVLYVYKFHSIAMVILFSILKYFKSGITSNRLEETIKRVII